MDNSPHPRRLWHTLLLAAVLNLIALIALAWALGWLPLLRRAPNPPQASHTTQRSTGDRDRGGAGGGVRGSGATASMDIRDIMPEGYEIDFEALTREARRLIVEPAEVVIEPGQTQSLSAHILHADGRREEIAANFSVDAFGQISDSGLFQANQDANHQTARVVANVPDLEGVARVHIVPPLPWVFRFDQLDRVPGSWYGTREHYTVRKVEGRRLLVNVPHMLSHCLFGPNHLANYTVQVDILATRVNEQLPDIGVMAQGYLLELLGNSQQLQLRTGSRPVQTVDFPWSAKRWYVLQLSAGLEGEQAVLRAKVWPRNKQEPQAWTIEVTDTPLVKSGSPGLFGNTRSAEIMLDNILVSAH